MLQLSIITINLNNKEGLLKTVDSVINQTYSNFEFIIIDGGSIDGSIDVIQQCKYHKLKWISEKDNGIYNAMNKGILKSSGEYLLFLNSGDYLYSNEVLTNIFKNSFVADLMCCSIMLEKNGKLTAYSVNSKQNIFFRTLPHQSTIIKKELFFNIGFYNESFKIAADYDFFVRAIKQNVKCIYSSILLSVWNTEGISCTNIDLVNTENQIIRKKYFNIRYLINKFFMKIKSFLSLFIKPVIKRFK